MKADARLAAAQALAVAGLAIFLIYDVDEMAKEGGTLGGFLPIASPMLRGLAFQLSPLVLSAIAFALSWNRPSVLVSAALVANGALMVIDGATTGTRYFTILVLPGPIIGFAYGLAILALGTAKGAKTRMAMTAAAKQSFHSGN